jgi:hypothetical protein
VTKDNLALALRSLCETDPPEVTGQGIEENDARNAFGSLFDLGALVHVSNSDSILCLACGHPHSIGVEYVGDGLYRAYCPDSGYQQVRPETLRRLVVAEDWIARTVGSSLGLNPSMQSAAATPSTVARIGRARFGQYACDLFFGRRLSDKHRFGKAKQVISAVIGKAPRDPAHDHSP